MRLPASDPDAGLVRRTGEASGIDPGGDQQ
jgi:hypothetical protein